MERGREATDNLFKFGLNKWKSVHVTFLGERTIIWSSLGLSRAFRCHPYHRRRRYHLLR